MMAAGSSARGGPFSAGVTRHFPGLAWRAEAEIAADAALRRPPSARPRRWFKCRRAVATAAGPPAPQPLGAPLPPDLQPPELRDYPLLAARYPGERGRGLVASRDVRAGEHVLRERLFVGALRSVRGCDDASACRLLAPALREWQPAARLDEELHRAERQFPRLVLRMAERILVDFVQDPAARAAATWGRLRELCRANVDSTPEEWRKDFQEIRAAMCLQAPAAASGPVSVGKDDRLIPCNPQLFDVLFSEEWFVQTMGVLHLNTFRLPLPLHGGRADSSTTISGVLLAASLINHSCAPNLSISFEAEGQQECNDGRGTAGLGPVCFVAARDITAGEECTSECATDRNGWLG